MSEGILASELVVIDIITEGVQGLPGIQGPRGFPGPSGQSSVEMLAGAAISGQSVVYLDDSGSLQYASNDDLSHARRVVGMTIAAAEMGTDAVVKNYGLVEEPGWNWDPALPVYLGLNGGLTQVVPSSPAAKFTMVVGFPVSSTSMFVSIREPIVLSN